VDDYPLTIERQPTELLALPLGYGDELRLPANIYQAVVPVLHAPSAVHTYRAPGGKLYLSGDARVVGTAFSIHSETGIFVTAAHVFDWEAEDAVERGEYAILLTVPGGQGLVLPLKHARSNDLGDVAVCSPGVSLADFKYPCVPAAPLGSLLDPFVVTLGYPGTVNDDEKVLRLWPAAYVGESEPVLVSGRFSPRHKGVPADLEGDFLRVPMKALPGHSGGPLLAFSVAGCDRPGERHVTGCRAIGVLSWSNNEDPGLASTYFADIKAVLNLPLPAPGDQPAIGEWYPAPPTGW